MVKSNGISGLVLAMMMVGTGAAFAEGVDETAGNDAAAIGAVKVSPAQAIQNAEAKAGGKAVSLDFVSAKGASYYHVEVVAADGSEQNLAVDAASGEVMKAVGNSDGNDEQSDEGGEAD